VNAVEDAGVRPFVQAVPADPARAVGEFGGQFGPADAGGEHEGDALKYVSVRDPRAAARRYTAGLRGGISGSNSAHNSLLIS